MDKVLSHLKNNKYKFLGNGVDHNEYDYLYIKNEKIIYFIKYINNYYKNIIYISLTKT